MSDLGIAFPTGEGSRLTNNMLRSIKRYFTGTFAFNERLLIGLMWLFIVSEYIPLIYASGVNKFLYSLPFTAAAFCCGVFWIVGRVSGPYYAGFTERISEAEERFKESPQKAKPAWDLARLTLEAYFQRNLSQITWIFWLSLFVMFAGFGVILWAIQDGISIAANTPEKLNSIKSLPPLIAAFAGIITEFIGATFLFIYRSTIQQAALYSKTLERINSVGMAMQILDTMPDETKKGDLKSETKAKLVELLVRGANEQKDEEEKPKAKRAPRASFNATA